MDNPFAILAQKLENIEVFMETLKAYFNSESGQIITGSGTAASEEPLVSLDEIAAHIGCKRDTVLKYARNKVIPYYKAGRTYRFRKSETDLALSSQTPIKRNKKGVKANG